MIKGLRSEKLKCIKYSWPILGIMIELGPFLGVNLNLTRTKSVPSWPREMRLCTVTMHKFDSLHSFILCTFIVHDLSSMHRFILCTVIVHSYCAQIELYARDYSVHNLNFMQGFILWTVIVHTLKSMHRLILWTFIVHDLNSLNRFKLHTV